MESTAQLPRTGARVTEIEAIGIDWARLRFAICITIFGGAVGIATVLVNHIARIEYPDIVQRLTLWDTLLFGTAGFLGSALVAAPSAYWLFGPIPTYLVRKKRASRGFRKWVVLSLTFGLLFPFVTGAVFIPVGFNLVDFGSGLLTIPEILAKSVDLIVFAPSVGLLLGIRIVFTGMIAAVVFAPGAWLIDRFNLSDDPTTARYGTWAITVVVSLGLLAFVAIGPEQFLARLG